MILFLPGSKLHCLLWMGTRKEKVSSMYYLGCFAMLDSLGFLVFGVLFMVQEDNKLYSEAVALLTTLRLNWYFMLNDSKSNLVGLSVPKYHDNWTDIRSERINELFACFAMVILFTYTRITFRAAKTCLPGQREQEILQLWVVTTLGTCRCISSATVTLGRRQFSCHQVW